MANYTLNKYEPVYFGIKPEAIDAWVKLCDAQDRERYYPCLNNPYFYMDYDGLGLEDPSGRPGPYALRQNDADALCAGCPIMKQCYDFAVANDEKFGIWGGILFGMDDKLF